jgi:hypothetical protein
VAHHHDIQNPLVLKGKLILTEFAQANTRVEHDVPGT